MKWKNIKTIAQLIIVIVMGSITMCHAAASVSDNITKVMISRSA